MTECEALPALAWVGPQGAKAALVSRATTVPLSPTLRYFSQVLWDKPCGQCASEYQCVHPEVPTSILTQPSWPIPPMCLSWQTTKFDPTLVPESFFSFAPHTQKGQSLLASPILHDSENIRPRADPSQPLVPMPACLAWWCRGWCCCRNTWVADAHDVRCPDGASHVFLACLRVHFVLVTPPIAAPGVRAMHCVRLLPPMHFAQSLNPASRRRRALCCWASGAEGTCTDSVGRRSCNDNSGPGAKGKVEPSSVSRGCWM